MDNLIGILQSKTAEFGDKHDAGMQIAQFSELSAQQALVDCINDETQDEGLIDACCESLAEIWSRRQQPPTVQDWKQLTSREGKLTVVAMLERLKPQWAGIVSRASGQS